MIDPNVVFVAVLSNDWLVRKNELNELNISARNRKLKRSLIAVIYEEVS